jgi:hypothetical protein
MVGCTEEAVCRGYKHLGSFYTDGLPPRLSWCKWNHVLFSCSMLLLSLVGVHTHTFRSSGGGSVQLSAFSFLPYDFSVHVTHGFKELRHIRSILSYPSKQ